MSQGEIAGRAEASDGDTKQTSCSVFILSDIRLYRDGITAMFATCDAFGPVHAGVVAQSALIPKLRPDVLLLDATLLRRPDVMRNLRALDTRMVAFAVSEEGQEPIDCAEAGVAAYVCCDASASEFLEVVAAALRGEALCSPQVTARLFRHIAATKPDRPAESATNKLTQREMQVLPLVERGYSNKEIARRLNVETSTVKNHIHNILAKLRLSRRAEVAAFVGGRVNQTPASRVPD